MVFIKDHEMNINSINYDSKVIQRDFTKTLNSLEKKYSKFDKDDCSEILSFIGGSMFLYSGVFFYSAINIDVNKEIAVIYLTLSSDENILNPK